MTPLVSPDGGAARDRHERAVRCDGREWRTRRRRLTRTAKSCGPGVAVLALSPREAKLLGDDGGKKAVLRGELEVSRKAIAQGRPGCSRCTCMLVCVFLVCTCTRDRGCGKHPVFPVPSDLDEGKTKMQASGKTCREIANSYSPVIASAAKQSIYPDAETWIASLRSQ
jgi:hypothetical protein